MKLLHATTVPSTLRFLEGHAKHLGEEGTQVVLLSSPAAELEEIAASEGARAISVDMKRAISPAADVVALARLVRVLKKERPEILHAHTPKAGLLVTLAGRIARVPVCVYQIHGLRFATATGAQRVLLKTAERVACASAHAVLCVSPSALEYAEAEHIICPGKGRVIGAGTINGVDTAAFDASRFAGTVATTRHELEIPASATVIGFVGRVVRDKGIAELADAWQEIRDIHPDAHLLLVGAPEETDPVDPRVMETLEEDPRVHITGFRADVRPFLASMDVLVLPSYREGFGQTLLEASSMGVATAGSDIPGIRDAVVHDRTGLLFPAHDSRSLARCLDRLLGDARLRAELGAEGRRRVLAEFDRPLVREQFLAFYRDVARRAR
ncbi:glycosyltransferase family 1 protein [Brachybacterium endophyticum]|uniref:D-inositol 3-phosphate glycosyltransferase n=1 Tax=Brachybacterium endophyticum TaxID=2182385 RepID=A0A2U2RJV1_9MICO|nr:glycosyltransferase family 4 protein [Brachybacterium endophyticum]PWH06148.1 glycosyltransferase family 1 protein [Brachybacterium endophyticum]